MTGIKTGIDWIIGKLKGDQSPDGSWNYPFETGITTDAYMIILLRTLGIHDEELIRRLCSRIISRQSKNGSWKLYYDENQGNLDATIEAYYSLLYSGLYRKEDTRLTVAKNFILSNGGLKKASMFTKIMLALTGQYPWPAHSAIPIELILLPLSFPINFYKFSVYGRANLAPILILTEKKFSLTTEKSPDISDLETNSKRETTWMYNGELRSLISIIEEGIENLLGLPGQLHELAIHRSKKYILDHLEEDGTLYSYFSSTFLMIFALLALGHQKTDSLIVKAVEGLKNMKCEIGGIPHMQYTTANVWNTSLISYALQEAGVSPEDPDVRRANDYLLSKQHQKFGDWVIHNPNSLPGGWGFSQINTINPDMDDTTASLRALSKMNPQHSPVWDRGINWLLAMQNDDGGWASFEKNASTKLIDFLPIEKAEFLLSDPSTADLTGRTLEFFGNYRSMPKTHDALQKAVKWLLNNQEADGSWYGRWGICYLYGTWASVTGLLAAGVSPSHSQIRKAVHWLERIQNTDGGWGESCRSDIQKRYVPLQASTITHTSWALDTLVAAADYPTEKLKKTVNYLLSSLGKSDWTTDYPKGQGMGGAFYIHYHSYRYVFPLLALSHYQTKFGSI